MTIAEAKTRLPIGRVWTKLELPGDPGVSCRSPFRLDEHPSFSISEDGRLFYDFADGKGGDAIDFLQRATGLSKSAACRAFIEMAKRMPARSLGASVSPEDRGNTSGMERAREPKGPPTLPNFWPDQTIRLAYMDRPLKDLAKLRHLRFEAVQLAYERGLLKFYTQHRWVGEVVSYGEFVGDDEIETWVITDGRRLNAQMRRLDGRRWEHLKGGPKSWTWPGAWGKWPIGIQEARGYPLIVLVEGGPDLLAAHHFAELFGQEDEVGVVGMMGASMTIHPDALPLFTGKRVRIIPDADDAGRAAAKKWSRQLQEVGAEVDAFSLEGLRLAGGAPVQDLNDCCLIDPDDAEQLDGLFVI